MLLMFMLLLLLQLHPLLHLFANNQRPSSLSKAQSNDPNGYTSAFTSIPTLTRKTLFSCAPSTTASKLLRSLPPHPKICAASSEVSRDTLLESRSDVLASQLPHSSCNSQPASVSSHNTPQYARPARFWGSFFPPTCGELAETQPHPHLVGVHLACCGGAHASPALFSSFRGAPPPTPMQQQRWLAVQEQAHAAQDQHALSMHPGGWLVPPCLARIKSQITAHVIQPLAGVSCRQAHNILFSE